MSSNTNTDSKPILQPSTLGKLVKLENCPQYFKFKIENEGIDELSNNPEDFTEAFHGGNIVEAESGNAFERDVVNVVSDHAAKFYHVENTELTDVAKLIPKKTTEIINEITTGVRFTDVIDGDFDCYGVDAEEITLDDIDKVYENASRNVDKSDVKNKFYKLRGEYTRELLNQLVNENGIKGDINQVATSENPVVVFQGTFKTTIGDWVFAGDADLIFIWPSETQTQVRVVDVKLSNEEQTNHQLQATIYNNAIKDIVNANGKNTVDAGILTPESEFLPLLRENIPSFNISSRNADLTRITKKNGVLDSIYNKNYNETRFQLNDKCATCEYNEACYTMAIEEAGLELLNINRGTQRKLEQHGVNDLNDLAKLAEPVSEYANPVKDTKPRSTKENRDTYQELSSITGIGEQLPELIQQAQSLLQNINPDNDNVNQTNNAPAITNKGYGSLPNDEVIFDNKGYNEEYLEGSMIRIYVNVQFDHIRDVIAGIGFTACATGSEESSVSDVFFDTQQPDDTAEARKIENELIEGFCQSITNAIETIEKGIDFDGYKQDNPFVHIYTYSESEKQTLQETLALHSNDAIEINRTVNNHKYNDGKKQVVELNTSNTVSSIRSIATKQNNKDEENISAVVNDIENRFAIREPTTGLINVYKEFYASEGEAFKLDDWKYTENAGKQENELDLTEVFGYRFFDNSVGYVEEENAIRLMHENKSVQYDGWLNSRFRQAAQIPIAYLWSATGKIEEKITAQNTNIGIPIKPFIYRDRNKEETKIKPFDVEQLILKLTKCLRHTERGINKKDAIKIPNQEYENNKQKSDEEKNEVITE